MDRRYTNVLLLLLLLLLIIIIIIIIITTSETGKAIYIIFKFCRLRLQYLTPPFTSIKGVSKPSYIQFYIL